MLCFFFVRVPSVRVPGDVPPPGDPLQLHPLLLHGSVPSPAAARSLGAFRKHPPAGAAASGLPAEGRSLYRQHLRR